MVVRMQRLDSCLPSDVSEMAVEHYRCIILLKKLT